MKIQTEILTGVFFLDRVKDLEDEKADKELKSFEVQLEVKPEYHPKLIGRGNLSFHKKIVKIQTKLLTVYF